MPSNNGRRLKSNRLSEDIEGCTRQLHELAKARRVTGLAFVAWTDRGGYIVDIAGDAITDKAETRRMIPALLDKLIDD